MLKPESWVVLAFALFGIVAAAFAYARTPADKRNRIGPPGIEERLAACAPADKAVVIRADWRRALRRDLPTLLLTLPCLAFTAWLRATKGDACASLFGLGRTSLVYYSFFVLVPVALLGTAVVAGLQAMRAWRGGYWPPLDTATYVDTIAISGPKVRMRAIALLALMALTVGVLAAGYAGFARFGGERFLGARMAAAQADCAARPR